MLVVGLANLKFMKRQNTATDETSASQTPASETPASETHNRNGEAMKGRLEAIWIKRAHKGPMDAVSEAELVEGQGLKNNADQGGRRQVTILSKERWEEATVGLGAGKSGEESHGESDAAGFAVDPKDRRANLFVSGLNLQETRGWMLAVGGHRMVIAGETRPCAFMDDICYGLQDALRPNWGGGAYAQVLDGGAIYIGDEVTLTPPSEGN